MPFSVYTGAAYIRGPNSTIAESCGLGEIAPQKVAAATALRKIKAGLRHGTAIVSMSHES